MDGEKAIRLGLELFFPLQKRQKLKANKKRKRTCCIKAAGTTMSVVFASSLGSGVLMDIVAIICTVLPVLRVSWPPSRYDKDIPKPISSARIPPWYFLFLSIESILMRDQNLSNLKTLIGAHQATPMAWWDSNRTSRPGSMSRGLTKIQPSSRCRHEKNCCTY